MPTVGGPQSGKRKTLGAVAQSIMLYAAPIWEGVMKVAKLRHKLASVQRKMAIRICGAYKTIFGEALVIASLLSIDFVTIERTEVYEGQDKAVARR
ncbi:hypothetical protein NQ314_020318 [Rhamnusium bicolor]|uniref:Uncharacterized protein n=1 Tax=Rhamnusium bicolor TaxID=1586634 RepID=A0AAV8WL56_9CUCU|nr:hypothetical protein NQ314_020318 [Rhamnusium bicolor]